MLFTVKILSSSVLLLFCFIFMQQSFNKLQTKTENKFLSTVTLKITAKILLSIWSNEGSEIF